MARLTSSRVASTVRERRRPCANPRLFLWGLIVLFFIVLAFSPLYFPPLVLGVLSTNPCSPVHTVNDVPPIVYDFFLDKEVGLRPALS
jgi:hypothetical protein